MSEFVPCAVFCFRSCPPNCPNHEANKKAASIVTATLPADVSLEQVLQHIPNQDFPVGTAIMEAEARRKMGNEIVNDCHHIQHRRQKH